MAELVRIKRFRVKSQEGNPTKVVTVRLRQDEIDALNRKIADGQLAQGGVSEFVRRAVRPLLGLEVGDDGGQRRAS